MSDFCTGCGKAMQAGDRFCAKCGRERGLETSARATTTSATSDTPDATDAVTTTDASSKKSPASAIAVVIAFCALGPVLFFMVSAGSCKGDTTGNVVVASGPRPGFTFTPDGCVSMQPYGRFGANIHGVRENDGAVYVTRDPITGGSVEVEIPGSCKNADGTDCTVIPLPRDRCRTFDISLDYTGVTVNDVRQVKGHVGVDCTLEDGTTVRGRIVFDDC